MHFLPSQWVSAQTTCFLLIPNNTHYAEMREERCAALSIANEEESEEVRAQTNQKATQPTCRYSQSAAAVRKELLRDLLHH